MDGSRKHSQGRYYWRSNSESSEMEEKLDGTSAAVVNRRRSRGGVQEHHESHHHHHQQQQQQQQQQHQRAPSFTSEDSDDVGSTGSHGSVFGSIDEILSIVGFGFAQYKILLAGGLLLTVDAMEMMLLSFLGPAIRCEFGVSEEEEALLTTVVFLGAVAGAYTFGVLADRYGRRSTLKVLSCLTFVLAAASAASPNYTALLVTRGLLGVCLGGGSLGFSYVMEMLPISNRGRFGILMELFWTLGTVLEASLAWIIFSSATEPGAWRTLLLVSSLPILIAAICFLCNLVPQSPRYLLTHGRTMEAYNVLLGLANDNGSKLPLAGGLKDPGIDAESGSSKGNPLLFWNVLRTLFSKQFRLLTTFLWVIWFANAFTYYGVVLMTTSISLVTDYDNEENPHSNSTPVSGESGLYCDPTTKSPFRDSAPFVEVFIATISELPGVLFAAFLVDSLGRKYSQALCFAGTFIALITMLMLHPTRIGDTTCLFFSRALIDAAFVLTYVYTPEVYPTVIRTTGFGLANSFSRVGGMVAPFVGAALVEEGKRELAILIFAITVAIGAILSVNLPVETKNAALADTVEDYEYMDKIQTNGTLPDMEDEPRFSNHRRRTSSSGASQQHVEIQLNTLAKQ